MTKTAATILLSRSYLEHCRDEGVMAIADAEGNSWTIGELLDRLRVRLAQPIKFLYGPDSSN